MRPRWGDAEIGAFADHPGTHVVASDADRIVGAVAGLIVAFRRRADIGADAAKPQEVHARLEDRRHHLERRGLRLGCQHSSRLHASKTSAKHFRVGNLA